MQVCTCVVFAADVCVSYPSKYEYEFRMPLNLKNTMFRRPSQVEKCWKTLDFACHVYQDIGNLLSLFIAYIFLFIFLFLIFIVPLHSDKVLIVGAKDLTLRISAKSLNTDHLRRGLNSKPLTYKASAQPVSKCFCAIAKSCVTYQKEHFLFDDIFSKKLETKFLNMK